MKKKAVTRTILVPRLFFQEQEVHPPNEHRRPQALVSSAYPEILAFVFTFHKSVIEFRKEF